MSTDILLESTLRFMDQIDADIDRAWAVSNERTFAYLPYKAPPVVATEHRCAYCARIQPLGDGGCISCGAVFR